MRLWGILLTACVLALIPIDADASGYIQFSGIRGGSPDYGYSGWIELYDIEWNIGETHKKKKATYTPCDMRFVTKIDKASPKLQHAAMGGTLFPLITFEAARPNDDDEMEYYSYEIENAAITSYTLDIWQDGHIDFELVGVITLECKRIQVTGIRKQKRISAYSWIWNVPELVEKAAPAPKKKAAPTIKRPRRAKKINFRTFDIPAELLTDTATRTPSTTQANNIDPVDPVAQIVQTKAEPVQEEINLATIQRPDDVPEDAWYLESLALFLQNGTIDVRVPFQPQELATRGEVVKLVLQNFGRPDHEWDALPEEPSFVDADGRYFSFFEEAARAGWIRGEGNCFGKDPCYGRPNAALNRAAAAMVMYRVFELEQKPVQSEPPPFSDVKEDKWYATPIKAATAHCILQGDEGKDTVRPGAHLNRAEMVTMVARALADRRYPNCN